MISKYKKISTINARLVTDKPVRKTPYQVKGVIMKQLPNEEIVPMLNGSYREKFLYPRVQVKILNEQIYIVGIGEGAKPIKEVLNKLKTLNFGNITFDISDIELEESKKKFTPSTKPVRYSFMTPWVALNHSTGKKYSHLNNKDRVNYLNKLLGQNIVFISRDLGIELEDNIFTKINLSTFVPKKLEENNWASFDGEFETNFILPNYIGIGNGITRGYGTLNGLFNSNNKDLIETKENSTNNPLHEKTSALSDFQEIDVKKIPTSNKRKKHRSKISKKILNEEFVLEDHDNNNSGKYKNSKRKKNKYRDETKAEQKKSSGEINYNSEEYHKKQHKF